MQIYQPNLGRPEKNCLRSPSSKIFSWKIEKIKFILSLGLFERILNKISWKASQSPTKASLESLWYIVYKKGQILSWLKHPCYLRKLDLDDPQKSLLSWKKGDFGLKLHLSYEKGMKTYDFLRIELICELIQKESHWDTKIWRNENSIRQMSALSNQDLEM